jgi:hypothetical protein
VHFVFDGGVLADDVPIRLQEDELDDYRFVEPAALDDYLPLIISTRVADWGCTRILQTVRAGTAGAAAHVPVSLPSHCACRQSNAR